MSARQAGRTWRMLASAGALAAGSVLLAPGVALAAGGGYGSPPSGPGTGSTCPAALSVQTVPLDGGTFDVTVGGAHVRVVVPPHDFAGTAEIVFSSLDTAKIVMPGRGLLLGFGVHFDRACTSFTGSLRVAVEMTVTDPAITASTVVYELLSSGTLMVAPGWHTTTGEAAGTFDADPRFVFATAAVGAATTGAAIPGATTATTGKPFLGEGLLAMTLVAAGGAGLLSLRRARRRHA